LYFFVLLSEKVGGPSVFPLQADTSGVVAINKVDTAWAASPGEDRYRRGIYTHWRRTAPFAAFAIFDAPSRENCSVRRPRTNTPLQALAALNDPAADLDKNGRVSVWELFVYTARRVARHYELQGLLATERPLLDDSGDGVGIEAVNDTGTDGALARATYLEREAVEVNADAEMAALIAKRRALEERAEQLRQKKPSMPQEAWEREFEQLMIELARVSHRIRAGS